MTDLLRGLMLVLATALSGVVVGSAGEIDFALEDAWATEESRSGEWEGQWALGNSRIGHRFSYRPQLRETQPGRQGWQNSWLFGYGFAPFGMDQPVAANWYGTGFINVVLDGEQLHSWLLKVDVLQPGGPQATLRTVWDTPQAKVTLLWSLRSGDDKVLVQGTIEPPHRRGDGFDHHITVVLAVISPPDGIVFGLVEHRQQGIAGQGIWHR